MDRIVEARKEFRAGCPRLILLDGIRRFEQSRGGRKRKVAVELAARAVGGFLMGVIVKAVGRTGTVCWLFDADDIGFRSLAPRVDGWRF